ncbi:hypothetical protein ACFSHQ_11015 [Gemmobacter lanyuensis]
MAQMNRRLFLRAGAAALMGCSAAASPLLTTVTLAGGAPMLGDHRLVVVILRGGLDGLDMVQPVADPLFSTYRPGLTRTPGLPLDGIFALNARLAGLMPLWKAGSWPLSMPPQPLPRQAQPFRRAGHSRGRDRAGRAHARGARRLAQPDAAGDPGAGGGNGLCRGARGAATAGRCRAGAQLGAGSAVAPVRYQPGAAGTGVP